MHAHDESGTAGAALIYVVDDEPSVRGFLSGCLRRASWRVDTFSDAEEALAAFAAADPQPALVIADFVMPGLNGLELLKRCKARIPTLKTMSCTASLTEQDVRNAQFAPDKVLLKPFAIAEFLAAVTELLKCGQPLA